MAIFKKDLSQIHSSRLLRMRLKLIKYQINIVYVPGKQMHIADLLSRSFSEENVDFEDEQELTCIMSGMKYMLRIISYYFMEIELLFQKRYKI